MRRTNTGHIHTYVALYIDHVVTQQKTVVHTESRKVASKGDNSENYCAK